MVKVLMTIELFIDLDGFGSAYTNEEYLVDELKQHIEYAADCFGADDISFNKIDVEGL